MEGPERFTLQTFIGVKGSILITRMCTIASMLLLVCATQTVVAQECNWNIHPSLQLRLKSGAETEEEIATTN